MEIAGAILFVAASFGCAVLLAAIIVEAMSE